MGKDPRFLGYVKPAESLILRILAATSAGGHALIIDVSRFLYVVQKSKIAQKFSTSPAFGRNQDLLSPSRQERQESLS